MTLRDISYYEGLDYDSSLINSGDGYGSNYENWDKNAMMMCKCNSGYFGPDCSLGEIL